MGTEGTPNKHGLVGFLDDSHYVNAVNNSDGFPQNRTNLDLTFMQTYEKVYYIFCVLAASTAICTILYTCSKCLFKCLCKKQSDDIPTEQRAGTSSNNEVSVPVPDETQCTTESGTTDSPPDYHTVINDQQTSTEYHRKSILKHDVNKNEPPPPYDSVVCKS